MVTILCGIDSSERLLAIATAIIRIAAARFYGFAAERKPGQC
jgi:hypothetical protein